MKIALLREPVLYADETGSFLARTDPQQGPGRKVNGKLQWLHILTCASYTLYGHHRSRGYDALVAMGVLPDYRGTLMHDAWRTYLSLPMEHALCNAHLLRELRGLHEHFQQGWAGALRGALQLVYHQRKNGALTTDLVAAFKDRFDALIVTTQHDEHGQKLRSVRSKTENVY